MSEGIAMIGALIDFVSVYWLGKCMRTMICGMALLPVIFLVRYVNRGRNALVDFYSMLLLLPALLMGMSKLYFLTDWAYITVWMYQWMCPVYGEIYFAVVFIMLARYLVRSLRLRRQVRRLPRLRENPVVERAIGAAAPRKGCRVSVYVTEQEISPYSGGILRPFIVVPHRLLQEWPEEKLHMVLCHELVHIRSGHIIWMTLFRLLRIYWWINPMVYLCERLLREDMELVCDEICIQDTGIHRVQYGSVLLEMIGLLRGRRQEGTVSFLPESDSRRRSAGLIHRDDFQELRRRISYLGTWRFGRNCRRNRRRVSAIFGWIGVLSVIVILCTSYPRYTRMTELALYDENIQLISYDSPEVRSAVRVREGRLYIDEERFRRILEEENVQGDYVYVSFDTIMKVPGVGGGGNTGMISVEDMSDIFYLSADTPENHIMEFILKFI